MADGAALRLGYVHEAVGFEFEKVPITRAKAEYYYTLSARNGSEEAQAKLAP